MRDNNNENIVNIDGSTRYGRNGKIYRPKKRISSKIRPETIGAAIFVLILIYMIINIYLFLNRNTLSIYEVQSADLSYRTKYTGIAVREEKIVYSDYDGYINYYVHTGSKTARNGVVFSIDSGSHVYSELKSGYDNLYLSTEEIVQVKSLIRSYIDKQNGNISQKSVGLKDELNSLVFDMINKNMLDAMVDINSTGISNTAFYVCRAVESGVISYVMDSDNGLTTDKINKEYYEDKAIKELKTTKLKTGSLVTSGNPVYRICSNEEWHIIAKVEEKFYLNMLEERKASVYINSGSKPVECSMRLFQDEGDYYADLTLSEYMSRYIDDRYLDIEFDMVEEDGLKIPVSAISTKGYYLVPLSCFMKEDGYSGNILKREKYNAETGKTDYEYIVPSKYYSDGYYAYIDMSYLNDGEYLCNTETGERVKVGLINYLEGVYNVNKGYYRFQRIERLRQNSEYVIIKKNTPDGVRRYDHIAMNSEDAVDSAIISDIR